MASQNPLGTERKGAGSDQEGLSILLTTDPGIEVTVAEELLERSAEAGIPLPKVRKCPTGHAGTVEVRFGEELARVHELLFRLRSIHHILKELDLFHLPREAEEQLPTIRRRIEELDVPEFRKDPGASFRVSCDRLGDHTFSSHDVLREAGAAIQKVHGLPVDLEQFRYHFRVDIHEKNCRIGLQWTQKPQSKRGGRPFLPRIALKGNIAYALLKTLEAGKKDEGPLLDPFAGSGTILLEAAQLYPSMHLFGSDNYARNLPGLHKNLNAYGIDGSRVNLKELDARDLSEVHPPESFRYIATNPPYGFRLGSGMDFRQLYTRFLEEAAELLSPEGRMAILVMKKGLFRELLEKNERFELKEERELVMGKLHTWLYVLDKC